MIKLKNLISEEFDYSDYAKLNQEDKIEAAMQIISSPDGKMLTDAEVFHIILSVPRTMVKPLYRFALEYLSPEQLVTTKKQIDTFYK